MKAERSAAASAPPPSPDNRRRVLLIEDDNDIAEAIAYQLEKVGLQVKVARTGEEGLEAVRRGADLVLLDLNLPGMDGLEVCRMIRRQNTTAHVPSEPRVQAPTGFPRSPLREPRCCIARLLEGTRPSGWAPSSLLPVLRRPAVGSATR